jgi:hypothetical protein
MQDDATMGLSAYQDVENRSAAPSSYTHTAARGSGLPVSVLMNVHPESWQAPGALRSTWSSEDFGMAEHTANVVDHVVRAAGECPSYPTCGDCQRYDAEQRAELRGRRIIP